MKKLIFSLLVVIVSTNACTSKNSTSPNERLSVHFPAVHLLLDPHKMEDLFSMVVVGQIHRGLLRYSPSGDVVPDLAKEWVESSDHKVYTFKLREAKFSNGQQIEARHVVMSFARIFATGAAIGADIDYIEGAPEFKRTLDLVKLGIRALSPTVVEFRLRHPSALFLKHLSVVDCAVMPLKSFNEPITFNSTTGYAGPYKVASIDEEGTVTIERWRDDALQSKSPPKVIRFTPSSRTPIDLARAGATDTLDHDSVSAVERDELLKAGWTETPTELIGETYVILNPAHVTKELRTALVAAISPDEAARVLGPKYVPAWGAIPRGVQGEMRAEDYPKSSLKKIKGTINLEYISSNPVHVKLQSFLRAKWEEIGVKVNVKPMEKRTQLERVFGSQCEVCIGQKALDYADGYSVLTYFKSEIPANYFHVKSKAIDAMIDAAGMILDRSERESRYREVQKAILNEQTFIPVAFGTEASGLWGPKVKSVPPHVIGFHMLPFEGIEMADR